MAVSGGYCIDKIKDALWRLLGHDDTVIEWDSEGMVISGFNNKVFVLIKNPNITPDHTWRVYVYPKVCVDTGRGCDIGILTFDSDDNMCMYLDCYKHQIYDVAFNFLSESFKELNSSYEYRLDIGGDRCFD
jgi:hypothetical protein